MKAVRCFSSSPGMNPRHPTSTGRLESNRIRIHKSKPKLKKEFSHKKLIPGLSEPLHETSHAITSLNYVLSSTHDRLSYPRTVRTCFLREPRDSNPLSTEISEDMKRPFSKTEDESRQIREKLDTYTNLRKRISVVPKTVECELCQEDMKERFRTFNAKINCILSNEAALVSLEPLVKDKLTISSGLNYYYQLPAKLNELPLRFHAKVAAGRGMGELYLSQRIPRPNRNNCDKLVPLDRRDVYSSFYGAQENDKYFVSDYIFITIQADCELSVTFEYGFGKGIQFVKKTNPIKIKTGRTLTRVPTKVAIEKQIQLLLKDKHSFEELSHYAYTVMKRRRDKYMKLAGNVDYIDKNKEKASTTRCDSRELIRQKQALAITNRDQRDEESLKRKFLFIHRREIKKHYVITHS